MKDSNLRTFRLLQGTSLLIGVNAGLMLPLLPRYAEQLQASPGQIGLLLVSEQLAMTMFALVWGFLSDRFGRKPVLIGCLLATAAGGVMTAFCTSFYALLATRFFAGAVGAELIVIESWVGDIIEDDGPRAARFGAVQAAFGTGAVVGPGVTALLVGFGLSAPFVAIGVFALVNAAMSLVLLKEPVRRQGTRSSAPVGAIALRALRTPGLNYLLATTTIGALGFGVYQGAFSLWLARPPYELSAAQTGLVFTLYAVMVVIGQALLVGRISGRLGEIPTILLATAGLIAALLVLSLTGSIAVLLVIIVPLGFGEALANSTLVAAISRYGGGAHLGELLGAATSASTFGHLVGLGIGASLLASSTRTAPLFAAAGAFAVCLVTQSLAGRHHPPAAPPDGAAADAPQPPAGEVVSPT